MLQFSEIQEIVAEAPERHALMFTRKAKARRYQRGSISKSESGNLVREILPGTGRPPEACSVRSNRRDIPQKYEDGVWRENSV